MRCAGIKQSFITRLQMLTYMRIRQLRKNGTGGFHRVVRNTLPQEVLHITSFIS